MRITIVLPDAGLSGGVRVIAIYAEGLIRRGHDVLVVSTPKRQPPLRRKVKSFILGRGWIKKIPHGPSHLDGLKIKWRVIEKARPITDDDVPDADVVVATWWETAEWVSRLSDRKGVKAYFIQHDEQIWYPEGSEKRRRAAATWSLPMHKITISTWLQKLIQSRVPDADCPLVLNSVDTDQFHAEKRGPRPSPTIGLLYSPDWFRGTDVALAAYQIAARKIPGLKLVAFGMYSPTPEVPLPPGAHYEYQPAQDRIREIYGMCDVWILPSRLEGFGLPILEAMACRCVVISTRVGCTEDVMVDGVNGFLVNADDAPALADRIIHVFSLPIDKRMEIAEAGLKTVTGYTWDDAVDRFESALSAAIEKARVQV